jgi:putative isomerase
MSGKVIFIDYPEGKILRDRWFEKLSASGKLTERDLDLVKRASDVLTDNTRKGENLPWGKCRGIVPCGSTYNGVWNWDSAFHAIAVARWDSELAYEQFQIFFDNQADDGLFPDCILVDGKRFDNYSKPPVFPWAFDIVNKQYPDEKMLAYAYEKYVFNESFWRTKRFSEEEGLFHYDATHVDNDWLTHIKWESGMDDSPRWDEKITEYWAIDLNSYMVTFYDALISMAKRLGKLEDIEAWQKKKDALVEKINTVLWDDNIKCYVDVDRFTGEPSRVLTPCCFAPLFAKCADADKAAEMAKHASNPELFYPGMPTVAYNDPEYRPELFWRGPTWLNVAYFAIEGLYNYGYDKVASEIKDTILDWCDKEKRDIFETYNSRTGEGCNARHFGWSSVFIIELIMRYNLGEN